MFHKKILIPFANFLFFTFLFISNLKLYAQFNAGDSDTTFGAGAFNKEVQATICQPDGKIIAVGYFDSYKRNRSPKVVRLHSNGQIDLSFNVGLGADNIVRAVALQTDGKIIIGGDFVNFNGVVKNRIVRLNSDGSIDNTFLSGTGVNQSIAALALQPDGKIIVGGSFTSYNGNSASKVVRLDSDGNFDNTFNSGGSGGNFTVNCLTLQPDGKLLIGGTFNIFNGNTANQVARLLSDGSLDNTFSSGTGMGSGSPIAYSIKLQSDGKIIIVGGFVTFRGISKNNIVRLNSDGTLDNGFNVGTGFNGIMYSLAIQSDGKILVGGSSGYYNGVQIKTTLIRLNSDASIDISFQNAGSFLIYNLTLLTDGSVIASGLTGQYSIGSNFMICKYNSDGFLLPTFSGSGVDELVFATCIQPDGKIIVAGQFYYYNTDSTRSLMRLNMDGTKDLSFNARGGAYGIKAVAVQSDGKIIIGGVFSTYDFKSVGKIARLNSDGSLDNSFLSGSGINSIIYSIVIQPNGKILVGGIFSTYNGTSVNGIIRLNKDGSLDTGFTRGVGPNGVIYTISLQGNGQIIIGGSFTTIDGVAHKRIARLNSDGTLDNSFVSTVGADADVLASAVTSDNKIIIGGDFNTYNGSFKRNLIRLNSNGSLDNTFNSGTGINGPVYVITLQSNGKILAGGTFSQYNGNYIEKILRLNSDGTFDNTFNCIGANNDIRSISIQKNKKIIVSGYFNSFNNYATPKLVQLYGDYNFNSINGFVYSEGNNDCVVQSTEKKIPNIVIKAMPGAYYASSDNFGRYQLLLDTGTVTYTIEQQLNSINSKLLIPQCTPSYTIPLTGSRKDTCCFNFADAVKSCSILNVSIQKDRLRRCFRNSTFVTYGNNGNADALNVQIRIEYPAHVIPISSTPMWTSKEGSILIYNIGTVVGGFQNRISLIDSVICGNESIRGLTQCIKVSISPKSDCINDDPGWDKSSIIVNGKCLNDSVRFSIANIGSGNMSGNNPYRVFMNDTLIYTGSFTLQKGESFIVKYPSKGQTMRLEADQHILHPGKSRPRVTIENCGIPTLGLAPRGLITSSALDDLNEETAISCLTILDSFDPNDKQVIPSGIGTDHTIFAEDELEYTIRFQNTGTDTAYTVTVVDTLDVNLEAGSVVLGTSSHPYKFSVSGKGQAVLTFTFNNINLPDSTIDLLKSNGLLSFRVSVPESVAAGTFIRNKAYIYFDFNSPILTNETKLKIGTVINQDLAKGAGVIQSSKMTKPDLIISNPSAECLPKGIDLTATSIKAGSTSNLTYTYYTDQNASSFLNKPEKVKSSGIYYIVGENEGGLTDTSSVLIVVNPQPVVVTNAPNAVCSPNVINLTSSTIVNGSTNGLSYSYFNDAAASNSLAIPAAVVNSGNYYIVGTDGNGCKDTASVVVNINPKPNLVITDPFEVFSPSVIDLTASAITIGSTANLSYSYFNNMEATSILSNPSMVSVEGTYYIVGKTSDNCYDTSSVNVIITAISNTLDKNDESISVYPNPSNGFLNLAFSSGGSGREIKIYSILGLLNCYLKLDESYTHLIDISYLDSGVYFYEILQSNKRMKGGYLEIK